MLKHPLWLRLMHWLNVPLLLIMIWSGILIYWAYPAYGKIPEVFIKNFRLSFRLAEGMGWHFFIMWIFTLNGLLYLTFFFITGHWKKILPKKETFKAAVPYLLYDFRLKKTSPEFEGDYNPLQRLAYSGALLLAVVAILSGWAIFKPVQLPWLTFVFGGYQGSRLVHFLCMVGLSLFIMVHLVQVMRAGWKNFRAMVAGA